MGKTMAIVGECRRHGRSVSTNTSHPLPFTIHGQNHGYCWRMPPAWKKRFYKHLSSSPLHYPWAKPWLLLENASGMEESFLQTPLILSPSLSMGKTMAIVGECLRHGRSVSTNTSHPLPFTIHGQNHGYCWRMPPAWKKRFYKHLSSSPLHYPWAKPWLLLENASGMEEAFLQTPLILSPSLSMGKTMAIVGECLRHGRSVSTNTSHPLPFTIHGQNHGYCWRMPPAWKKRFYKHLSSSPLHYPWAKPWLLLENASGMEEAFLQTPLILSPSLSMGKTMAIVGECLRHGRSVSTNTSHPLPFTIHGQNHGYCWRMPPAWKKRFYKHLSPSPLHYPWAKPWLLLVNAAGMEESFLQTPLILSPSLSMGKTMAIVGECLRHGRSVSTNTSHPLPFTS